MDLNFLTYNNGDSSTYLRVEKLSNKWNSALHRIGV